MPKLPPRDSVQQFQNAKTELSRGHFAQAVEILDRLSTVWPDNAEVWHLLGTAHYRLGQLESAIQSAKRALEIRPEHKGALLSLINSEYMSGKADEALKYLQQAHERFPAEIAILEAYSKALVMSRRYKEAIDLLYDAIESIPDNPHLHVTLGIVYIDTGDINKATIEFKKALEIEPDNIHAHLTLGHSYQQQGNFKLAEEHNRKVLELNPASDVAYVGLAELNKLAGYYNEALHWLDKSKKVAAPSPVLLSKKVEILEYAGRHEEAYAIIREMIDRDELVAIALMSYAHICHKFGDCEEARALIDRYLETPTTTLMDKQIVNFAAGKMLDNAGSYDEAFRYYRNGNEDMKIALDSMSALSFMELMDEGSLYFNGTQQTEYTDFMLRTFDRGTLQSLPRSSTQSSRPIFIVGMPRSGTSLTEQILAAHPQVFGAGELANIGRNFNAIWKQRASRGTDLVETIRDMGQQGLDRYANEYLEMLAGLNRDAFFVTDKMPHNFQYIGLITLLFPKARIIHCRRNPMDNALSIYFQQFTAFHRYATDLEDIGIYYRAYDRLMRHWESVIDIPIHVVQYEDMISDQEATTRALLDYCGIDWDDAVLHYHESRRPVATASYDQVRQPVYKSSSERWRNYDAHLGTLKDILMPAAE